MPEDMESHDDAEISDAASENDSEHENEPEVVDKDEEEGADMAQQKFEPDDENGSSAMATKPKLDPKDPLRPRRKKARRACFACQRAHLTCGMSGLGLTRMTLFRLNNVAKYCLRCHNLPFFS